MKLTTEATKVKKWTFNDFVARRPVKLVAGLVVGTVILSGTAVYFGPDNFQEERVAIPAATASDGLSTNFSRLRAEGREADRQDDSQDMLRYWERIERDALASDRVIIHQEYDHNPTLDQDRRKIEQPVDLVDFFGQVVVAALGYEVLGAKLDQYLANGLLTSRQLERLDHEIDILLLAEASEAYNADAISEQEVGRLEDKINTLLSAEDDPSANLRLIDREIERLDYQINMTMINSARHPSARGD